MHVQAVTVKIQTQCREACFLKGSSLRQCKHFEGVTSNGRRVKCKNPNVKPLIKSVLITVNKIAKVLFGHGYVPKVYLPLR